MEQDDLPGKTDIVDRIQKSDSRDKFWLTRI
jgi:hypothetical protein